MKIIKLFLLILLFVSVVCLPNIQVYSLMETDQSNEEFFFGVTFGGNTTSEAKLLIDKVKGYTNLFVINSWDIVARSNEADLNEICEYAVDANMSFMVYFNFIFWNYTGNYGSYNSSSWDDYGVSPWHISWINAASERWGNKFLGVYLYDEPGGKQIDTGYWGGNMMTFSGRNVTSSFGEGVANYSDAADRFVTGISRSGSWQHLTNTSITDSVNSRTPLFTSDYALYWFDYLAGYDAVFAEFGWNHDETEHMALCRGAANVQEKDWGVIITWASNDPPYLASGIEMLKDMNTAYNSGAKYLLVFNYPQINPYGALTEEHFTAIKTFWNQIHTFPRNVLQEMNDHVAFVLPKDYGWGMRDGYDNIWGFWPPDDLTTLIGEKMVTLLNNYGSKLDIIFDDPQFNYTEKYSKIYFWNSTIIFSTISCEVSSFNISIGDSITVSGSISPAVLANVTLQISADNGITWNYLTTLPSTSDGRYSYTWAPAAAGSYELEASWEGDTSIIEATSSNVVVTVVSKILTTISYSVSSSLIREGDSVTVSGVTDPAVSGKIVTLNLKRPDGVTLNRTVTTASDGSFVDSFKPNGLGYWSVTVSLNEDFTYAEEFSPEQSFKLTNLIQDLLDLPPSTILIIGSSISAIPIIAIVAWLITRPPKASTTKSAVKAHLYSLGSGRLEFIDNIIRFQWEKGHFRKRTETVREIRMANIKSMNRTENVLTVVWKGVTDIFIIKAAELAGSIFEMIPQTSVEQRRMFEDKEDKKKKLNELVSMLSVAMETVDSLFDILRSLSGWVDWSRVEGFLKRSEENTKLFKDQKTGLTVLDFTKLSSVIKERQLEEISKETYSILRFLYDYFSGLATTNGSLEQIHPNYHDAKITIRAYYLLNDIILGMIVGERVEKEINAFGVMLEDLSKNTGLKINIDALKDIIDKVGVEKEKVSVIEESRILFRKQLKDFKKIEPSGFIKHPYPLLKPSTVLRAKKIFRLGLVNVYMRLRIFFVRVSMITRNRK